MYRFERKRLSMVSNDVEVFGIGVNCTRKRWICNIGHIRINLSLGDLSNLKNFL